MPSTKIESRPADIAEQVVTVSFDAGYRHVRSQSELSYAVSADLVTRSTLLRATTMRSHVLKLSRSPVFHVRIYSSRAKFPPTVSIMKEQSPKLMRL